MRKIDLCKSMPYSIEKAVKIHMNTVTISRVKQNILAMAVTQTKNIAHHWHHSSGVCIS